MARMSLDTAIRLSAEVKGGGNIDRVKKSLQDLGKNSQTTAREISTLRAATFQFARANDNTIAGIRSSIGAFRGLQEQAKIGSREFQRYGAEIQKLEGKLRGLDGTANQTNTRIAGMAAAAGRLIAAYAGIEAVRFVFGNAAELESQTRSLEVLTGSAERAKQIVEDLQRLGAVTPFTSTELIDTAKRLQAFGVETEKVVDITKRLADVSGATGAELAGLATAYGQVQAKGRLQGEELLQFQERGVALQQILRQEYGLTGVEFQKALEKGQISAEAVEYALRKLTDAGGKYANGAIAQSDTLRGRMSTLADSVQVLAQTIGKTLEPVFKWALTQATAVVSEIQRLINEATNAGGARDRELQYARNADAFVRGMGLNPFTQQGMMAEMRQRNIEQQRADYELARQRARGGSAPTPPPSAPPPLALPGAAGGGGAGAGTGGGAAAAPRFELSSRGKALVAAAQKLGVSPLDLATIISFETAGTFSPSIRGGAGGNYQGLIQFGAPERRQYGVTPGQSFEEQVMGPVVRYFQDRFKGAGMSTQGASLLDLYTTVLAGNPRANRNARDSFGTSAVSGVQRMGPHRQKALSTFFGGSMENVGFGAVEQAQAQVAGYEENMAAMEQLKQQQAAAQKQLEEFNEERAKTAVQLHNERSLLGATTDEQRRRLELEIEIDNITQQHLEKLQSLKAIEEEIARLGGVAETAAIREGLEREKEQQLALARLRAEQDLNEILAERQRMMQDLTRQASEPAVFNVLEQQKRELDEILQKYPAIGQAADAAASLVTSGVAEMIAGTKSAKEVFADFLQGIASALIDTAKKMIAQYIAIGIARMFAGIGGSGFGGFAPGGVGGASPALGFDPSGFAGGTGIPFFANGGIMSPSGPLPLKAYSRGGVASTPQVALFGEGSMNEAYVPLPDGRRIPVALQAPDGARGDRMRELMGASPAGSNPSPVLAMSFETTTINGVEYVSRDQLEAAMAETRKRAANDGAKRGMSMTLDRLQQSPSTRSRVGIR
jgi:tape measure domain-containing protein